MLDIRRIRQNPQELIDALQKRNSAVDLTEFLEKRPRRSRPAAMKKASALPLSSARVATRSPSWTKCARWATRSTRSTRR